MDLAEAVQANSQATAQQAVATTSQKYKAVPGVRMLSSAAVGKEEKEGATAGKKVLYTFFGLVVAAGLITAARFDEGIRALYRAAEADGVFCYTFFKAVGVSAATG